MDLNNGAPFKYDAPKREKITIFYFGAFELKFVVVILCLACICCYRRNYVAKETEGKYTALIRECTFETTPVHEKKVITVLPV